MARRRGDPTSLAALVSEGRAAALARIRAEHVERGCGVFGRDCRCTCADHPCSEPVEPVEPGVCPTCAGAGVVSAGLAPTRPGELAAVVRPCPACDLGELVLAPSLPWIWARSASLDRLPGGLIAVIVAWLATPVGSTPFLVLYGAQGVGKTYAAVVAARLLTAAGMRVHYCTTARLLGDLRAQFGREEPLDVLGAAREATALVLDDFGREQQTDWAGAQIFDLVNARYDRRLTTILTTNRDPYVESDNALWGRLTDVRMAAVYHYQGPDRRKEARR